MSQRLLYNTKWLWCLLVVHIGSIWGQPRPVTVRTPPSNPSTIEAQAKFFQYRHFPTTEEFNQGHRLGSERHFTERHERAKPSEGLFSAKVRWGDKKGGYGEHYWDLNHAGNSGNHGDGYDGDDGSYHDSSNHEPYDEPSDHAASYGNDDYDPEKSSYEESGRAKRHHPKVKLVRKQKQSEIYEEESKPRNEKRKNNNNKNKEDVEAAATHHDEEYEDDDDEEEEYYEKPKPKRHHYKKHEENDHQQYKKEEENEPTQQQAKQSKEKNQFVLVVSHKDDAEKQKKQNQPQYSTRQHEQSQYLPRQTELPQYLPKQPELPQYLPKQPELPQYLPKQQPDTQFVPYEGGAGVRQHQQPEVSAATTVPRLFLEPSTGHVVDRATGQAYVLQPIAAPKNYN